MSEFPNHRDTSTTGARTAAVVPARPAPARPASRSVLHSVEDWIRWFGPARLVTGVVAAAALAVGVVWVIATPPPGGSAGSTGVAGHSGAPVTLVPTGPLPDVTLAGAPRVTVAAGPLFVHIAGAVASPGVHEVEPGARVIDALAAAGGPHDDAVLDALNLAAPVADGQRVHVPVEGEALPYVDPGDGGAAPGGQATQPAPVDVNRASVVELERLPGVGPALAAAIVEDRTLNGPFHTVDDLIRVRGIGPAKLRVLAPLAIT